MSPKIPTTWIDVVQTHIKAGGAGTSLKDAFPTAQVEWAQIKSGSHPTKEVGKSAPRKSKKSKKSKEPKEAKSPKKSKTSKKKTFRQAGGKSLASIKKSATKEGEADQSSGVIPTDKIISDANTAISSGDIAASPGENMGNFPSGSEVGTTTSNITGVIHADNIASGNLTNMVASTDLGFAEYPQNGGATILDKLSSQIDNAKKGLENLNAKFESKKEQLKTQADKVKQRVTEVKNTASGAKSCVDTHINKLKKPAVEPAVSHSAKPLVKKTHGHVEIDPKLLHNMGTPYQHKTKVVERESVVERIKLPGEKPFWLKVQEKITQTRKRPDVGGKKHKLRKSKKTNNKKTKRGGKRGSKRGGKRGGKRGSKRGGKRGSKRGGKRRN